jgi:hypothetical protein
MTMKKATLCLLTLHLAFLPCFADVIPSKYAEKDPAARAAVQARLEALGAGAAAAERKVQRLAPDELAFFGRDPGRIQPAGGLYWYEWTLGGAVLGGLSVLGIWLLSEYNEQND